MLKKVSLCSCEYVFSDNSHALLFENKEKRNEYYNSKVVHDVELSFYYDDTLTELSMPYPIGDFTNINYLFFDEKFFFINDKIIINDNVTRLIISLDVIQTYIYDCNFYPSFVDRCHVKRVMENGYPTKEVVSEGLAIGDYVIKSKEVICDLSSSCVLATTTPLGYMEKNTNYNPVE